MSRVTVDDLGGLLHAIDCMASAVEAGAEDEVFLADAEGASNCRDWVIAEIKRRNNQKLVRSSVKRAKEIINKHSKEPKA